MSTSATSEQIVLLYKMQNTPEEIARMLELNLEDVLLLLQARNLLSEKNIKKYLTAEPVSNEEHPLLESNQPKKTAKELYEQYQVKVAERILQFATAYPSEEIPAGVIAKCAMYANEEATGRNESRAKKNNNGMLSDMAQLMQHLTLANAQVDKALGLKSSAGEQCITIESEKV